MRVRVPMRGTGAEHPVVVMKVLYGGGREGVAWYCSGQRATGNGRTLMDRAKPYDIPKREVWEAYKKVRANQGAAGVDGQMISDFEDDLTKHLYKVWNRLSSGSYFPPPVRRVDI